MPDKKTSEHEANSSTDLLEYEQQPKESAAAFGAFQIYRDMGPDRTMAAVVKATGKSMTTIKRYNDNNFWVPRAKAWDARADSERRSSTLNAIKEMRERQIKLAREIQEIAAEQLRRTAKKYQDKPSKIMDPKIILKMVQVGTELERLNHGEPNEILEASIKAEIPYTKLSTEQLLELKKIKRTLEADKPDPVKEYIESSRKKEEND